MGPFGDRDVTPDWREGLADSPYPGIGEKQVAARLEPPPQPPQAAVESGPSQLSVPVKLRTCGQM